MLSVRGGNEDNTVEALLSTTLVSDHLLLLPPLRLKFSIQKLSLATAPVNKCDHFCDYPKPFLLKPLQATTLGAEEIGQTVVKEFVQDN